MYVLNSFAEHCDMGRHVLFYRNQNKLKSADWKPLSDKLKDCKELKEKKIRTFLDIEQRFSRIDLDY